MASNTSTSTATAGTSNITGTQQQGEAIYSCKWGNVIILNRENYPSFASTCRTTLIVAGAWDITQGKEVQPTDTEAGKDWAMRRGRAIQIMYFSTTQGIRDTLDTFTSNQDT